MVRPGQLLGGLVRRQDGGVLVMFALWLPVLVLFASFVIDVGNWFEHRRHLQVQADAAALAAAGEFRNPCSDTPIIAQAQRYGGVATTGAFNAQIGGTPREKVHMLVNSPTWFNQPGTVDSTVNPAGPCAAGMIDVKLTETDLPWFFDVANVVPFINAHARVEIKKAGKRDGALPVAVPQVNPRAGRVELVAEDTGAVLASAPLARVGVQDGLAIWNNAVAPMTVDIDRARIGVRVILSGSSSTTCGEPLVECYEPPAAQRGVNLIRGYSTEGTVAADDPPRARDVDLTPGGCPDGYFVAAPDMCRIGIDADVDFGSATDPVADLGANVTAKVVGDKTSYPLAYDTDARRWRTGADIPVAVNAGQIEIELEWERTKGQVGTANCTPKGNDAACKGSFGVVHRTLSAIDSVSGPIRALNVTEVDADGAPIQLNANSFPRCDAGDPACRRRLVVDVRILGNLQDALSRDEPPVAMRLAGNGDNSSRTQALDCDPAVSQFKDEIARGCSRGYVRNEGESCPASATALWSGPEPWRCVAIEAGARVNDVAAGLNERILGSPQATTCTNPNRWASYWTAEGLLNVDPGDPRLVQVFLTPFGAFAGSGGGTVPVVEFADFYVTGWKGQGSGFANPCAGQGDDPVPDAGYVVGHFLKYVDRLNVGQADDEACDLNGFGSCVAVLTH